MKHTCKVTTISVSLLNPSCVEVVLRPKLGLPAHRARRGKTVSRQADEVSSCQSFSVMWTIHLSAFVLNENSLEVVFFL